MLFGNSKCKLIMEDRLDNYYTDSDSGGEEVIVEDDFLEEELTGWIPEADDGGDDDERDVAEFDVE